MENKYIELTDVTLGEKQIDNFILCNDLPHQGIISIFKEMAFLGWMWAVYVPSFTEGIIISEFSHQLIPFSLS